MNYKLFKKFNRSVFTLCVMFLGLISCVDSGFEAFVPPTGNVNNIQPNTLFTTSTSADDTMSFVFRSYSTDATSYSWDFGDGNTSTEANPDYTYATGGLYTVTLTTKSSDGLVAEDSSDVAPILVDFDFTIIDSEVTFENLTSGAKSLVWDFGDGETLEWDSEDSEEDPDFNPLHIYKTAETFKATLTATTFLGVQVSVSKNIEGLILSTIPDFTFAISGFTVEFTDTSILAVSHSWDFGDGTTSTEQSPTHMFPGEGSYEVTLTTTNEAGVSKSITQAVSIGAIEATFAAVVQNSTCNDHTSETGDNADAWDMTPNSTVVDDNLGTIDSPYRAIWNNTDLNAYIDATYCTNEQPGSTSDGNKFGPNAGGGRGVKLSNSCRRLYQVVAVEPGVEYTFTIDTRSEAAGINTEVYILNNEITTEVGIEDNADAYFEITNDFNSTKSGPGPDEADNTFTTTTFTFVASSNIAVIYVRALNAVDSSNEVFIDNINIITPGFDQNGQPTGVDATFKAIVQNSTANDHTTETGDNADAWDMTPNSTVVDDILGTIDSPYRAIWNNTDLNAYIDVTYCTNEQPGSTGDGNKFGPNAGGGRGVKLSNSCRRLYQVVAVEPGVEYTFTIDTRSEAAGINTEVYILNNEITTEVGIEDNADAYFDITNDFNSSKSGPGPDEADNTFTTTTFTFVASSNIAVIYVRALNAIDSSNEVFIDNIDIITPGF